MHISRKDVRKAKMTLFLYAPETSAPWEDIERILEGTVMPDGAFEIFRTINDLSRRLRQPKKDLIIVVLLLILIVLPQDA